MEHIDPTNKLTLNHFCELFEQLPLNDDERLKIKTKYWPIYEMCLTQSDPTQSWMATKNTFIALESQIAKRIENEK